MALTDSNHIISQLKDYQIVEIFNAVSKQTRRKLLAEYFTIRAEADTRPDIQYIKPDEQIETLQPNYPDVVFETCENKMPFTPTAPAVFQSVKQKRKKI